MINYTVESEAESGDSIGIIDAVIDNSVVGYDGNFVLIEDDNGNQYRYFCDDRDSMPQLFPIGSTVDQKTLANAEPALFDRSIEWE